MKKKIHYAFVLDQSGSMFEIKDVVISNFNEQVEWIGELKKGKPGTQIKVTFCIFNDAAEFRFIAQDVDQIDKLTCSGYHPNSCTALYDALGITILKMTEISNPEDEVFLAVFTDGLENASSIYTASDINYKLHEAREKGWSIRFFCRYEDMPFYKNNIGIDEEEIIEAPASEEGFNKMKETVLMKLNDFLD